MVKHAPPVTSRQAARLEAVGLLADAPDGLQDAWTGVEQLWAATDDRAAVLPARTLNERVGGEWSYVETQRHLVFVTDAWLNDVILNRSHGYDPVGLPPDFVTNGGDLGLDMTATPTPEQVLTSRRRASGAVCDYLAALTTEELDRPCAKFDGQFSVLGALQNIIFEEWAHHLYAVRDLSTLETG